MSHSDNAAVYSVPDVVKGDALKRSFVHAYIFEGDCGGEDNETVFSAMWFAGAVLCADSTLRPCGKCVSCVQTASGNNPDIKLMHLSDFGGKKSIGAEDIRSLISDVYIRPHSHENKVYIIKDADSLTVQAQNAILKILEEPPSYAVCILCTTNLGFILPTVQSRSRVVRFDSPGRRSVSDSGKYPFDLRRKTADNLVMLISGHDEEDIFRSAAFFEEFAKSKDKPTDETAIIFDISLSIVSDMLRITKSVGCEDLYNSDLSGCIKDCAVKAGAAKLSHVLDCIIKAQNMLRRNVNRKALVLSFIIGVRDFDRDCPYSII